MSQPKNTERLKEIEYCISHYFYENIEPIMDAKRSELQNAQAKEVKDYSFSFSGLIRSLANASTLSLVDDSLQYVQMVGEECTKTAEDYVAMCSTVITSDNDIQADLSQLAAEWRNVIVEEVGVDRYYHISATLGADLALAYVDHRMEQMMIDKMVESDMPKSSMEYIIRKGAENSLFGLPQAMMKSPLQAEIDARGEAAYNPSDRERLIARGISLGADAVATGGIYSWGSLGRLLGFEVAFAGMEKYIDNQMPEVKTMTVEEIISKTVFDSNTNVFEPLRKGWLGIHTWENDYILSVNSSLRKDMGIAKEKPFWYVDLSDNKFVQFFNPDNPNGLVSTVKGFFSPMATAADECNEAPHIPMVIAPGQEQAYLDFIRDREQQNLQTNLQTYNTQVDEQNNNQINQDQQPQAVGNGDEQSLQTNESGWAGLLSEVGLSGIGDIGKNLGYVLAMLPDLLFGVFTGDTKSLKIQDNLVPLASILMGIFVKNPILKMLLIGMGGANLLNKAGHEALERHDARNPQVKSQYKQYADEPLNSRISNPAISGNMLVATIDRVPCSIGLPQNVIDAYNAGALPINTLANAVLAQHDRMQTLASQNYQAAEQQNQSRTIILR